MNAVYITAIVSLTLCSLSYGIELDYDGWLQLRLWHTFNDDPTTNFIDRGNITVTSVRNGASVIAQNGLTQIQMNELKKLAKNGGKYRLKVVARTSLGSETSFLSSLSACYLLGSDLEDTLTIWLGSTIEPIAITILSSGSCTLDNPFTNMWTSTIVLKYPDSGPAPDTATYIQKLEREREARERGETKDNRSFFAKYWMYIVPALILVLITSATNPEAAASGSVSGQRQ